MHPNPIFRKTKDERSLEFARKRAFGALMVNGDPVPLVSHVPFLLGEQGDLAELHLVRSNPIARMITDAPLAAKLSIVGPDSYISPDWYGVVDQVPTWNYVSVHLTGLLERRPHEELHAMLDRLSAHFERQLAPKPQWTSAKMSNGVMDKMMRAIAPFHFHVEHIDSTWKLGQNKTDDVRRSAAAQLEQGGIGTGLAELAKWMDTPPD